MIVFGTFDGVYSVAFDDVWLISVVVLMIGLLY